MSTRASTGTLSLGPRAIAWPATAWLGLILGLGAVARLVHLGAQSLWLDEGISYWIALRPLPELVGHLATGDTHPPLHYLVLKVAIALGGGEWLLRLPSVLAGLISIGLIHALGRELFDTRTGLVAAFIVAVSPLHIWHAQEARMYALVAMFTLAAGLFAVRAMRTSRWQDWALLVVCQVLALYTNTAAIWFTLALNTAALVLARRLWQSGLFWRWAGSQALAVGLWLPWTPIFLQQIGFSRGANAWIPAATFSQVGLTLADFISQGGPRVVQWVGLALMLGALTLGARALARDARAAWSRYALLICWLVVPITLAFIISQPYVRVPLLSLIFEPGRSFFLTRNLIVATFPLYLLLARVLVLGGRPLVATATLALLLSLNLISYQANVFQPSRADWRGAAALVAARSTPDDLILFVPPYIEGPFAYYFTRAGGAGVRHGFPHDDWSVHGRLPGYATPEAVLQGHARFWLVTSTDHATINPALEQEVATRGRLLEQLTTRDVVLRHYTLHEGAR